MSNNYKNITQNEIRAYVKCRANHECGGECPYQNTPNRNVNRPVNCECLRIWTDGHTANLLKDQTSSAVL